MSRRWYRGRGGPPKIRSLSSARQERPPGTSSQPRRSYFSTRATCRLICTRVPAVTERISTAGPALEPLVRMPDSPSPSSSSSSPAAARRHAARMAGRSPGRAPCHMEKRPFSVVGWKAQGVKSILPVSMCCRVRPEPKRYENSLGRAGAGPKATMVGVRSNWQMAFAASPMEGSRTMMLIVTGNVATRYIPFISLQGWSDCPETT
mmetsp:Transcript_22855/g.71078  ORF Transcript_22855/g.71078 Transcript_22855/m.71078 type:complete len:206 (+) Transcript_22855:532-1149(+)